METSETSIIRRILGGEKELFRYLVRTYEGMVYSLAIEVTGDEDVARDVAQEAFIKAYNALEKYDASKGRFSTWIATIAINIAKGKLRKRRQKPPTVSIDQKAVDAVDESAMDAFFDNPDEANARLLVEAIAQLPPDDRLLLTLFYTNDLSLAEIAEVTGARAGTIATRLSRIRKRLYVMMKGRKI